LVVQPRREGGALAGGEILSIITHAATSRLFQPRKMSTARETLMEDIAAMWRDGVLPYQLIHNGKQWVCGFRVRKAWDSMSATPIVVGPKRPSRFRPHYAMRALKSCSPARSNELGAFGEQAGPLAPARGRLPPDVLPGRDAARRLAGLQPRLFLRRDQEGPSRLGGRGHSKVAQGPREVRL
jgi:hypothetical protein